MLNITKRDKIHNEIIRSKTGVKYITETVRCMRTVGRTCSQNEQHQVGQDYIRMDTQRMKTRKKETEKEMERQHRGSWLQSMDESGSKSKYMVRVVGAICQQWHERLR